jgi:F-box associated domain
MEFSQISHPSRITRFQLKTCVLLDIQQKLCICQFIEHKKKVKYWVLEDYTKKIWRKKRAYMEEVQGTERNLIPLVCLFSCAVFVRLQKFSLDNRHLEQEMPVFCYWDFKESVPKKMGGDFKVFFYNETLATFVPPFPM